MCKWIKCSERLPEKRGHYLVWLRSKTGSIKSGVVEVVGYLSNQKKWSDVVYPVCGKLVPTHWAFLPEPPKE
jgi:hypothetical protein